MIRRFWPWAVIGLLLILSSALPFLDITVAGWFYVPESRTFPLRVVPFFEFFRKTVPVYIFISALAVLALWGAGEVRRRPLLGIGRRAAAFVALSLALGPGLVINLLLKENWGRARPSELVEFGGEHLYTLPLVPSDQCSDNCSFASGHAALGFWVVALALLLPPAWRPTGVRAGLAFGALMSFVRIGQGGHFLSDVLYAGLITLSVIYGLYFFLLKPKHLEAEKNNITNQADSP